MPTRTRNHPGLVLRFDGVSILVDPGEGTQRQLLHAGISPASIDVVWLTHVHGDHCLGVPGFLQRRGLDGIGPLTLVHPAAGDPVVDASLTMAGPGVGERIRLGGSGGPVLRLGAVTLSAEALDHRVPAYGLRMQEDDGVHIDSARAAALGVTGPDVGRLIREGSLTVGDTRVHLSQVSTPRPGQRAAVVMDTRRCPGAEALADGADLLVTESTFLSPEARLANDYRHLTAADAGALARDGHSRRLVLQHYSQRYPDEEAFAVEARTVCGTDTEVVAARDLQRVDFPRVWRAA